MTDALSFDDYLGELLASRPPLTDAQRERLRVLLADRKPAYPDNLTRELCFREDQAGWQRRAAAARRLPPLESGQSDPEVRWSA